LIGIKKSGQQNVGRFGADCRIEASHEPNATVIRAADNPLFESQMSAEKAAYWWAVKESNLQPTD
jgi:hypothetical protein